MLLIKYFIYINFSSIQKFGNYQNQYQEQEKKNQAYEMQSKIKYLEQQLSNKQHQLDSIKASVQEMLCCSSAPIQFIIEKLQPFIEHTKTDIVKLKQNLAKFGIFQDEIFQLIHHLPELYQNAFEKKYKKQYAELHSLRKQNEDLREQIKMKDQLINQYQYKIVNISNKMPQNSKIRNINFFRNIQSEQLRYQLKRSQPDYEQNIGYLPYTKTQNRQDLETVKVYLDTVSDCNKQLTLPSNMGYMNLDNTIRLKPNNDCLNLYSRDGKISRSMTARRQKNLQACFKQTDQYWDQFMKQREYKRGTKINHKLSSEKKNRHSIGNSSEYMLEMSLKNNSRNNNNQTSKFQQLRKAFKMDKYIKKNKFR